MKKLENQIALVTGASRGIGKAIALTLAQQGAKVIGTATSSQGADNISAFFSELKLEGQGAVLNVSDPNSIVQIIDLVSKTYGAATILVNNAGITKDNLLMRMSDEEWSDVINTNLTSIYRLSKAVLRGMIKARQGRIINISSIVALSGNPGQANYSAAKAGMIGFTKSLAQEVGSRAITVNAVAPGFIDTDMTRDLPDAQREALVKKIPLNRLGEAQEIANAVSFLASADAAYITGETLNVSGGMFMH